VTVEVASCQGRLSTSSLVPAHGRLSRLLSRWLAISSVVEAQAVQIDGCRGSLAVVRVRLVGETAETVSLGVKVSEWGRREGVRYIRKGAREKEFGRK
jgi:hypothetical protein